MLSVHQTSASELKQLLYWWVKRWFIYIFVTFFYLLSFPCRIWRIWEIAMTAYSLQLQQLQIVLMVILLTCFLFICTFVVFHILGSFLCHWNSCCFFFFEIHLSMFWVFIHVMILEGWFLFFIFGYMLHVRLVIHVMIVCASQNYFKLFL